MLGLSSNLQGGVFSSDMLAIRILGFLQSTVELADCLQKSFLERAALRRRHVLFNISGHLCEYTVNMASILLVGKVWSLSACRW